MLTGDFPASLELLIIASEGFPGLAVTIIEQFGIYLRDSGTLLGM
jgi:hypothetical protein